MNRLFLAILTAVLLWQCQDVEYPEAPDNLIDEQTMIKVYTDAYLANASKSFNRTTLLRQQVALTDYIYKKYDIDSLQYERSNAFYSADMDTYRSMFLEVKKNIDKELALVNASLEKKKAAEKKRKDSLRELTKRRRDSLGLKPLDSLALEKEVSKHSADTVTESKPRKTVSGEITTRAAKDSIL